MGPLTSMAGALQLPAVPAQEPRWPDTWAVIPGTAGGPGQLGALTSGSCPVKMGGNTLRPGGMTCVTWGARSLAHSRSPAKLSGLCLPWETQQHELAEVQFLPPTSSLCFSPSPQFPPFPFPPTFNQPFSYKY